MAEEPGDAEEPLGPQIKTRAEIMLQHLLDKQLATSGRLEQVEFKGATKGLYSSIHGSGGVATLAEFRAQQEDDEMKLMSSPPRSEDEIRNKRRRYGADPAFMQRETFEQQKHAVQNSYAAGDHLQEKLGRHEKELEISLLKGKGKLQSIAHLSIEGISYRKPLIELSEVYKGTTPEERARCPAENDVARSAIEVFSAPAPLLLDLNAYLEEKASEAASHGAAPASTSDELLPDKRTAVLCSEGDSEENVQPNANAVQIPVETILSNRLSVAEIREWSNGKFRSHAPGIPTNALYIKNLSSEVTEADLVALFLRYQKPGERILFRLMLKGRMKGQAFVTFEDKETAAEAAELVNGYLLKGRPMVVEYARGGGQKGSERLDSTK